ncbi:hypothetical protein [Oleiharenicola sp. Vm1]|uniref:hypothetical protein n=1 Tax=Oleiharenicola sp. Vm1 TaxID=3398393 RepID=UPI0039F4B8B0
MNIVPHDHAFGRDQAIDAAFQPLDAPTDWDAVIRDAAQINPEALIAELRAGEPYAVNELNVLKTWRLNTKIRIAHRYRRGLPQHDKHTCASCGVRASVPTITREWRVGQCLHCEEMPMLFPAERMDRGPLFVAWDSASGTWGLAWQRGGVGDRDKTAAVVVIGFGSYWDAYASLIAPMRFATIYSRACPPGTSVDAGALTPAGELFQQTLPLTPERWVAFCREQMKKATPEGVEPYDWEIRQACDSFFGKSQD